MPLFGRHIKKLKSYIDAQDDGIFQTEFFKNDYTGIEVGKPDRNRESATMLIIVTVAAVVVLVGIFFFR